MPVTKTKAKSMETRLAGLAAAAEAMQIHLVPAVKAPRAPLSPFILGEGISWPHLVDGGPDWPNAAAGKKPLPLTGATLAVALRGQGPVPIEAATKWCVEMRERRIDRARAILAEPAEADALVEMVGEMGLLLLEDLKEEQ